MRANRRRGHHEATPPSVPRTRSRPPLQQRDRAIRLAPLWDLPLERRVKPGETLRRWLESMRTSWTRDYGTNERAEQGATGIDPDDVSDLKSLFGPVLNDPASHLPIAAALQLVLPRWRGEH